MGYVDNLRIYLEARKQCISIQEFYWYSKNIQIIAVKLSSTVLVISRTYISTDISFVRAYGHGGRSLLTK